MANEMGFKALKVRPIYKKEKYSTTLALKHKACAKCRQLFDDVSCAYRA